MTIKQTKTGDVGVKLTVIRDGKVLQNARGNSDIGDFVAGIEIFESMTSATLEAKIIIGDTAGFLGAMTGSELLEVQILGTIIDKTFILGHMRLRIE